ncbi:hypothetical protein K457DRAFT_898401 [Linnemannia elongata AG-77]|uniref:F-box domain-containing protein n=1 Tax=Linnemannia elongata AG-77 TaxID=1314771 RepID=A0A197KF00_9FUNG|nr:hypothetical protein K457DRAFT_898401 [Linnemannia elongata AG-77]
MFMTTHASNRVSIVDNPLILDRICDNLTKVDLLPCLQVSRYWFALFQPHVIRRVEFVNLKKRQTWAILDSASRIRHLTIDISDAGWFLDNPKSPCTNLHELHCVDYDYQIKRLEDYNIQTCPSVVDQTKNALLLIEINPKLRTLTVDHSEWKYRDDNFTESVLKSLVTHKSLTLIHISIPVLLTDIRFKLYNNLPVGLQDFEFSYKSADVAWIYDEDYRIRTPKLSTTLLPALKQICLRGTRQRVPSHFRDEKTYISPFSPYSNPDSYYYGPDHVDYNDHHPLDDFVIHYYDIEATTLIRRSPQLRDLVLRDHTGKLKDLMQLLITFCPNLETIDLSTKDAVGQDGDNIETAALTTSPLSPGSRFTKLKEFRIEGEWSSSTHQAIAELVSRSTDTLEIAWFDRRSWQTITDTANPFHIGTEASWTRCNQLKELVLYQEKGFSMSDYCWGFPGNNESLTALDAAAGKDTSTTPMFSHLEKLKLAVSEPTSLECPDGRHNRFVFRPDSFQSRMAFRHNNQDGVVDRKTEREHRLAFVLLVRELYGRLRKLKRLRSLEIEWWACETIQRMTLEYVLQLCYETEFEEDDVRGINFKRREDLPRTSKGWWGPITTVDLSWLGLSWSTQAEQQERADTQQLSLLATKQSNVEPNNSYAQLVDPFRRRVGRIWEDWMYLVGSCPHAWTDRIPGRGWGPCLCQYNYHDEYASGYIYAMDGYWHLGEDHVVYSRDFESLSGGMVAKRGGRWGSRKANRGRF